jgi:hypothetical protein
MHHCHNHGSRRDRLEVPAGHLKNKGKRGWYSGDDPCSTLNPPLLDHVVFLLGRDFVEGHEVSLVC